ncbi:hypothetical protein E2C01_053475 [Portunus trituberculatus]|uniref:Uncharacterized protein n=1 Tax=Portunus trituberculatus TaxID=210409 RepID=A0A5B7GPJ5_PORTR|nr:hypothetical protein [Portunus trituberculatus]
MNPKRLFSAENKESSENASVIKPHPSTSGFTGITKDVFMDGDLSSDDLPPPHLLPSSSTLSITSLHLQYVQIKII